MRCSSCGTENEVGRKFCRECGTRLAAGCPSCGAPNPSDAKFCGECGTPLAGADPGPARSTLAAGEAVAGPAGEPAAWLPQGSSGRVAERRLVSVLFADLVGFTTFAEGRDAEEVRESLSRYFELAREIVARYGGTVEKFIGDAVMAVWGAPVAHEDDAERAVRAGLELVDAVGALEPGIQARCGVLTGEAAVTVGAVGEGMVAGDLVNTAARLQSVAPAGTVLVGEATQRAAAAAIAFEPAGEQQLKGKAAPVAAWLARRVVAERGGRNRAEVVEAPFVGRDVELRLLKDLFHATARERRPRLVAITGQAGIGKSRLAWEFLKYIDGLVETVWWHSGRSPAYGDGLALWALGEMVRGRAGLVETDDAATTTAAIRRVLEQFVPDGAERAWLEPALLALLGFGDRAPDSTQLFAAWRTFFERIAAQGPTVLVFEDLQWADAAQLDFIDHLVEWTRDVPIFVVSLARPELLERRAEWSAGRRGFASLALDPLRPEVMRELLEGLVPGLPDSAARAIVARADGIPLYAMETVRMLVAEGRLTLDGAVYRPTGDLTSLAIPETLQALIAARLDALEPADRSLIQDAAVLGQSFTIEAVAAVSGLNEAEISKRLRRLVQRELLDLQADARSPERGQYAFVQGLIREVAYASLARADRKTRHLAAARYFESLGTDELAGALAVHFVAAHDLAAPGPEADALAGQARVALRGAAERAIALGAQVPALDYLTQAAELTTDPAERADLTVRAGRAAISAFRRDEAEALLGAAVALLREVGDRPAVARAIAAQGRVMVDSIRSEQAIPVLVAAIEEFADIGDDPAMADLRVQLSRAHFMYGEPAPAVREADAVLPTLERLGLIGLLSDALVTKGSAMATLGRAREGAAVLRGGLDLARSYGIVATEMRGLVNLSAIAGVDDPRAGFEMAREGVELAARIGWHGHMVNVLGNAASSGFPCGEWPWLLATVERVAADEPDPQLRAFIRMSIADIRAQRRDLAEPEIAEFEALFAGETDPNTIANAHAARTSLDLAEGRFDAAFDASMRDASLDPFTAPTAFLVAVEAALWLRDAGRARRALGGFEALGVRGRFLDALVDAARAGIAALEGRRDVALAGYRQAGAALHDLDVPFEEARTAVLAAWVLGGDPALRESVERARTTLERLHATVLLERLDAIAEQRGGGAGPVTRGSATERSSAEGSAAGETREGVG